MTKFISLEEKIRNKLIEESKKIKLMSLKEAFESGLIKKGDRINPNLCFREDNKEVTLEKQQTGCEEDQIFKREMGLRWFYLDFQGIPTLFGGTTKFFKLRLKLKICREGLLDVLNTTSSVYSNEDIGFQVRALTEADAKFLIEDNFPKYLIRYERECLLADSCDGIVYSNEFDRVMTARKLDMLDGFCNYIVWYSSKINYTHEDETRIFPVISVQDTTKIFVDIESMEKDGVWKLIPAI